VPAATDEQNFIRLRILYSVFNQVFHVQNLVISVFTLTGLILLTYAALNSDLPDLLRTSMLCADLIIVLLAYSSLVQITKSNILSHKIISVNRIRYGGKGDVHQKFWKSMKPVRMGLEGVCTFETNEFLLKIWWDIIISKIIDLLVAF